MSPQSQRYTLSLQVQTPATGLGCLVLAAATNHLTDFSGDSVSRGYRLIREAKSSELYTPRRGSQLQPEGLVLSPSCSPSRPLAWSQVLSVSEGLRD